jgi:peptide-methionine (S)-S-oxide reductase
MATAIFAAGHFWGAEFLLGQVPGVTKTEVGYIGGHVDEPTYQQVSEGVTGHAMAVRVTYEPAEITYERLVEAFFDLHDPTQVDRQGPNTGPQFRSAIFFGSTEQENMARQVRQRREESGRYGMALATQIVPADTFWRAEESHQRFVEKSCGASQRF